MAERMTGMDSHLRQQAAELAQIIDDAKNIVFFGGAGVSTESGIPDFRSETGLYKAQREFGHFPEYLISRTAFNKDPELFFRYYKENLIYSHAQPNQAHLALAKLESRGKVKAIITQNIDGLHQAAGSKVVHELHGSIYRNFCMRCNQSYELEYLLNAANCINSAGQQTHIPYCQSCGGIVKPDVVLYEEPLNQDTMSAANAAVYAADTLIVGGTSLAVYPAAGFVSKFSGNSLIIINKGETAYDSGANLLIRGSIGAVLEYTMNLLA
jgi:NAD-dependent deacetylase